MSALSLSNTLSADRAWLTEQAQCVRSKAFDALESHAKTTVQAELLKMILASTLARGGLDGGACQMALHLPTLVHEGIRGLPEEAVHHLAAALTLLEAGIYTLDHLLDEELEGPLAELPSREVMLGAVCLISHLPYQVLGTVSPNSTLTSILARRLADGLAKIGAGQLTDIAGQSTSASMLAAVVMKTGERRALFAELAATLAGGEPAQVEAYADFGRALGIARQLRSDLLDLYGNTPSRDLASGVRTLPLTLYMERANRLDAQTMEHLLSAARAQVDVQHQIRSRLREAGVMREVIALIERHCRLALQKLEAAQPMQRAERLLKELALATSLLTAGPAT